MSPDLYPPRLSSKRSAEGRAPNEDLPCRFAHGDLPKLSPIALPRPSIARSVSDEWRDGLLRLRSQRRYLKRLLLVPALLAGEFRPRDAALGRDAVRRPAFSANRLDAGVALFDDQRLARHGLADQALGLFAHRLL